MEKWIWTESDTTFYSQDPPGGPPSRGGGGVKNGRKSEVLKMKSPIVENVRTSSDILLDTSRGLQLPYRKKSKQNRRCLTVFVTYCIFSYFSVWGTLLLSCYDMGVGELSSL